MNYHMKKLTSLSKFKSIPLLYPEGMLFPSIHWKLANDKCFIVGAIPSSLLHENCEQDGFCSIQKHIRTRLKNPSNTTSTDPRYICHCYDVMANLAATHNDTRLIINRGLTVDSNKCDVLRNNGNKDQSILGSVDSKQMVKICVHRRNTFLGHIS